MRFPSAPLTTLESRTSSSCWIPEHKKDFDPSKTIDQSVFDDAEDDDSPVCPPADAVPAKLTSTDSSVLPSDDSSLQRLIAASALCEQASNPRFSSSESVGRMSSLESTASFPPTSADFGKGSSSADQIQALLSSITKDDQNRGNQQQLSTYDYITQGMTKLQSAKPPPAPAPKSIPMMALKPLVKYRYVPPPALKSSQKRVYVEDIREYDVLCGRGGKSNHHLGNKRYRQVVSDMKAGYRGISAKTAKTDLSRQIVDHVIAYGGRFLKKEAKSGRYFIMKHDEARKKTSQALRETKELKWTLDRHGFPLAT